MISNQFLIVKPPYLFAFKFIAYLFQGIYKALLTVSHCRTITSNLQQWKFCLGVKNLCRRAFFFYIVNWSGVSTETDKSLTINCIVVNKISVIYPMKKKKRSQSHTFTDIISGKYKTWERNCQGIMT